jgi:hypothetical protein
MRTHTTRLTHTHRHRHTHAHAHTRTHTLVRARAHTHTHTHTCTRTHTHTNTHTHTITRTRTRTHTHTCTRTQTTHTRSNNDPPPRALSESAMKNMLSSVVDISNAWGLLIVSSAPLMDRHFLTCPDRGGGGGSGAAGRCAGEAATRMRRAPPAGGAASDATARRSRPDPHPQDAAPGRAGAPLSRPEGRSPAGTRCGSGRGGGGSRVGQQGAACDRAVAGDRSRSHARFQAAHRRDHVRLEPQDLPLLQDKPPLGETRESRARSAREPAQVQASALFSDWRRQRSQRRVPQSPAPPAPRLDVLACGAHCRAGSGVRACAWATPADARPSAARALHPAVPQAGLAHVQCIARAPAGPPCFISQPERSGLCQNSTSVSSLRAPNSAAMGGAAGSRTQRFELRDRSLVGQTSDQKHQNTNL